MFNDFRPAIIECTQPGSGFCVFICLCIHCPCPSRGVEVKTAVSENPERVLFFCCLMSFPVHNSSQQDPFSELPSATFLKQDA